MNPNLELKQKIDMKKLLYIVIWHEAQEVSDLVAGVFNDEQNALAFQDKLNSEATDNFWEVITKDAPTD